MAKKPGGKRGGAAGEGKKNHRGTDATMRVGELLGVRVCDVDMEDRSILDIDFDKLKEMFDNLPFAKRKELVNTFINKIVIDPEWCEIHYGIPTGFDPDRFLAPGPDDCGNDGGCGEDNGAKNGRRKRGKSKKRDNREDISAQKFFGKKSGEGTQDAHMQKGVHFEEWAAVFFLKRFVCWQKREI